MSTDPFITTSDLELFAPPPPAFVASYQGDCDCGQPIEEGDLIRSDGAGGYICQECIAEEDSAW